MSIESQKINQAKQAAEYSVDLSYKYSHVTAPSLSEAVPVQTTSKDIHLPGAPGKLNFQAVLINAWKLLAIGVRF